MQLFLLDLGTKVIILPGAIPPPLWKGNGGPRSAKHGKGEQEQRRQRGAVKGPRGGVKVVFEDAGPVVAQIKLGKQAAEDLAEDDARLRGADGYLAAVGEQLRQVDVFGQVPAFDLGDELNKQGFFFC